VAAILVYQVGRDVLHLNRALQNLSFDEEQREVSTSPLAHPVRPWPGSPGPGGATYW